jgi:scyllo-inositol 2-dehydrogenase (NADP+)
MRMGARLNAFRLPGYAKATAGPPQPWRRRKGGSPAIRCRLRAVMTMTKRFLRALLVIPILAALTPVHGQDGPPLRLAIAGLVHGHVSGFLRAAQARKDVEIVGVYDADRALLQKYAERYKLPQTVLFTDVELMLDRAKPEAVASFTNTFDHPTIVEAAASRHVHVMMEKPLAVSSAHAQRIRRAAEKGNIQVLVNYETTWYANHGAIWALVKERRAAGEIRKMVAMDGHSGPKAINVQPEFLDWLSDPVRNGAGALFDFGCYGANLMTWLMDNQRPLAVTAITQQFQPDVYPRVDDEATILLEYPKAQGIIQASWNWPFNRKDFEVYGERGLAIATTGGNGLRVALPKEPEHAVTPDQLPADERDSISHLTAVVRGTRKPNGLSSLENNLIATEILEAARESARTRRRVTLTAGTRSSH